jgi:hypothetical protein
MEMQKLRELKGEDPVVFSVREAQDLYSDTEEQEKYLSDKGEVAKPKNSSGFKYQLEIQQNLE